MNTPPERWSYRLDDIRLVEAPNWFALLDEVKSCAEANNMPVPSVQDVIDYVCRELHVPCYDSETRVALVNKFSQGTPFAPPSCCGKSK